jgi:hypothetical protein
MRYHSIARGVALGTILVAAWTSAEAQTFTQTATTATPQTYRLTEVAGKSLPAIINRGLRCHEEVTAAELTLVDGGSWLLRAATRGLCGDRVVATETDVESGRYAIEGRTVRFYDEDGRSGGRESDFETEIDLDDVETGTLAPNGTLTVRLEGEGATLVFRR